VGDYFHHVTVGVVEIDAATAVQMIDLALKRAIVLPFRETNLSSPIGAFSGA
jgi:hypothetical protein